MLTHLYVCNGGITKSWYPLWTALIEGNEPDRSGCLLSTAAHDYTDPLLLHLTSLSPIAMVKLHSHSSMCVHITAKIFPETQNTFLNNNNSKIKTANFKRLKQNQTLFKTRFYLIYFRFCQQTTHKYIKYTLGDLLNAVWLWLLTTIMCFTRGTSATVWHKTTVIYINSSMRVKVTQ